MKPLNFTIGCYFLIIILIIIGTLTSCSNHPTPQTDDEVTKTVKDWTVVEFRGCEYVVYAADAESYSRIYSISHKGNCKYHKSP